MAKNVHCHPARAKLHTGIPADWLVPRWPAPARVQALCTTRAGGVSGGRYDSMNLGTHVGDEPQAVARNRAHLASVITAATPGANPVFLNQVHGAHCTLLTPGAQDGAPADAAVTSAPGLACTIMVADCLPVLITDTAGRAVGCAHAGWRGLAAGVLEALVGSFVPLVQAERALETINIGAESQPAALLAWLGPCIGAGAFEVGPEVHAEFCAEDAGAQPFFTRHRDTRFLADLAGLARRRLQLLGVEQIYGNDGSQAWCTVRQASRFFSHRRDASGLSTAAGGAAIGTGRMAACIWLD